MQTAFHILSLTKELTDTAVGGTIVSTEFYKKERTALLFVKQSQRVALSFQFHPAKAGVFVVPASKIKMETREKPWPVFKLEGAKVLSVKQVGFDRIFRLDLEHEGKHFGLIFEALGPNGNLWLADEENKIQATLRNREYDAKVPYQPFEITGKLNPLTIAASEIRELAEDKPDSSITFLLEKSLLGCTRLLAAEIVKRSGLDEDIEANELDDTMIANLMKGIEQVVSFFQNPEIGYVYQIRGSSEAFPFKLSSTEKQPEKFKTLSLAVMMSTEIRQEQVEKRDEEKTVKEAVARAVKRLDRRLVRLDQDIAQASDFDSYRKQAELLQINFDKLKRGMASIELEDVYSNSEATITIQIDPALTPNENVEQYFKKYRKGREGLELLERRREITLAEVGELKEIQKELDTNFAAARQRFAGELASLLPSEGVRQETVERLPYKEYKLSTGLTIFVGRDGSDNDRTTFDFARPYELWFHTQQCPGSHVVMKYPNKSFEPSKREIEETAAIAAFFSKAKNDSLVPVVYTEKRYVRKPRKAKPGLVTVEREKSVMVEPTKPRE
jgi:predicted ribosome quality control (RQC) complex YloA/Tae2 family protein